VITQISEAFGWSAGFLVAGVVALVLAFWRRSSDKDQVSRI
jgi:hypothetical protein